MFYDYYWLYGTLRSMPIVGLHGIYSSGRILFSSQSQVWEGKVFYVVLLKGGARENHGASLPQLHV